MISGDELHSFQKTYPSTLHDNVTKQTVEKFEQSLENIELFC